MAMTVNLSKDFLDGYEQSARTAMLNLADLIVVEMKKLAPYAKPSQYPGGYPGNPGDLVRSISRQGTVSPKIVSSVAYAVRRNFENNLNPSTKRYIERSIRNTLQGKQSQWWRA